MAFHEDWRADGYRQVVDLLRAKAELRPGVDLERSTDLVQLFVGMDVYHVLIGDRGWSHGAWVDWAVAAVSEQVFGRNPEASSTP